MFACSQQSWWYKGFVNLHTALESVSLFSTVMKFPTLKRLRHPLPKHQGQQDSRQTVSLETASPPCASPQVNSPDALRFEKARQNHAAHELVVSLTRRNGRCRRDLVYSRGISALLDDVEFHACQLWCLVDQFNGIVREANANWYPESSDLSPEDGVSPPAALTTCRNT